MIIYLSIGLGITSRMMIKLDDAVMIIIAEASLAAVGIGDDID